MPEGITFPSIPDAEAIAALQRRGINFMPSGHWTELWQQAHHTAFTVAQSAGFDILKDIHAALERAMVNGQTFETFKKELTPILQAKGWWGRAERTDDLTGEVRQVTLGSPRRLRTIFDVNLRVSAAQGDWERQQAVKKERPYLRYTAILDNRVRPQHRRWHGTILPVDHPWWQTHYPPNGWRCRCKAMSVSDFDLESNGWSVNEPPDEGTTTWVNPRTGEQREVPRGIDPGWDYNPGNTDQAARALAVVKEKLMGMPTALESAAVSALVQGSFALWMQRPVGNFPLAVLPKEDAATLGATATVAVMSPATFEKQQRHHPELTVDDYALAQDAVDHGEKLRQDARKMAYVMDMPGGVVVIVKATMKGDELYVTSLRRMSRDEARRERVIEQLKKK